MKLFACLTKSFFVVLLVPFVLFAEGINYSVDFVGVEDPKILKTIRSFSQLIALRKKNPPSINILRFRAESDIVELVRVLHAYGYLEAKVDVQIEEQFQEYKVIVDVLLGPLYKIDSYFITFTDASEEIPPIALCEIGITIGDALETKHILDSELCVLQILSERGYPLATIKKRNITANGQNKTARIDLLVEPGPLCYFGAATMEGNTSVSPLLIEQNIQWWQNDQYNSCLVEKTQKSLIDTALFSSVYITHPKTVNEDGLLPMKIDVTETKHKSVSIGASYQTTYGPGATFGWENRNVRGLGRKILLQADLAQRTHSGIASYSIPNFHKIDQNYTIQAQATHESIKAYRMQSYTLLNRLDRQLNPYFFFSMGVKAEYLMVNNSVDNGCFIVLEAPIYLRFTNVQDFLNPVAGTRLEYRATPSVNFQGPEFYYSQTLTLSHYLPLWDSEFFILAQKLTIGSIFSKDLDTIPVPKRFLGGSEDNLRGYKYYTVSPLKKGEKPIGGRSAIYYSLEPRLRLSKYFGLVPFFDIGNVYLQILPTCKGKWRKSAGLGFRYYSFLGPLRLDVAFPLDRREKLDPHWWIFVSVGQTF